MVTDVDGDPPVKSSLVSSWWTLCYGPSLTLRSQAFNHPASTPSQHSLLTYITADGKSIQVTNIFYIATQRFIPAQFCNTLRLLPERKCTFHLFFPQRHVWTHIQTVPFCHAHVQNAIPLRIPRDYG